MLRPNDSSPERLSSEILAQAGQQSQEILRSARKQAETILDQARAQARQLSETQLALVQTQAHSRAELILATVPLAIGRERAAAIEAVLQRIYGQARSMLQERRGFDYRATLVLMASEAISSMTGDKFTIHLAPADYRAFGGGLGSAVSARLGRSSLNLAVSNDSAITESGLVVQDLSGHEAWDNRLSTRLDRLWPELRRQIAAQLSWAQAPTQAGGPA